MMIIIFIDLSTCLTCCTVIVSMYGQCCTIYFLLLFQKWWGLNTIYLPPVGVPREFLPQLYWTLKKIPETKYVCKEMISTLFLICALSLLVHPLIMKIAGLCRSFASDSGHDTNKINVIA